MFRNLLADLVIVVLAIAEKHTTALNVNSQLDLK